jgi:hypothetical protein
MSRESLRELLVFTLLVALGALGRQPELQPAWNFTPLAAATALGAFYFRSVLPAILLPLAILSVANLRLSAHDSQWVAVSVYLMSLLPVAIGRAARNSSGWHRLACWGLCGFVPATLFFVVTNFAVWATKSLYAPTFEGLMNCYVQALPFYRTMLAGDVCYVALMVGCLAVAQALEPQTLLPQRTRR